MANLIVRGNRHCQMTFEDLKGLRARKYIRDSTPDQQDGFGPDIQRRNEERFAETYHLILDGREYIEFVSGHNAAKRKEFQRFLEDARLDLYDVLLVNHTSRFGRNQEQCIRYKAELQTLGKTVLFVSQGIISGSDRDFLAERINETLDEQYSRNLSRYVAAGLAEKAVHGLANGVPPLGYRSEKLDNGKRERKVPDWEGRDGDPRHGGMEALLALLRGYSPGQYSYEGLPDYLNAQNYRNRMGKPFTVGSVEHVLSNRFYEGKVVFHPGEFDEEVRDGVHDVPLEVRELWLRCQEVKARRSLPWPRGGRHEARPYIFTGVLSCSVCGTPYKGLAAYRGRGKVVQRMIHGKGLCKVRPRSQTLSTLNSQLSKTVLAFMVLGDDFIRGVTAVLSLHEERGSRELEVKRLDKELQSLRLQHRLGDITDEEYIQERERIGRLIRPLKSLLPALQVPNLGRARELLNNLPALWEHSGVSDSQRQDLLRNTFEEVTIVGRELVAIRPRPEHAPHFAYMTLWQRGCLWSGRVDSNHRPPAPHAGALPGCATPRP